MSNDDNKDKTQETVPEAVLEAVLAALEPPEKVLEEVLEPVPETVLEAVLKTVETDREKFERLLPYIREYQELANKHNINDVFQDNGGKYVQILMTLGLTTDGAREGNDARDADGNEYEIKTVNLDLQHQISTHHHMNPTIIGKYRKVDWYFAPFKGIELQVIYRLKPEAMEPFYTKWEEKWHKDGGKDINNPKIPLTHVMKHGEIVWLPEGATKFEKPKLIKDKNRPVVPRKKKTDK